MCSSMFNEKCLFVYFSYTGHVESLIPVFRSCIDIDTFKLEAAVPYPTVVDDFWERYNDEIDNVLLPDYKELDIDFSKYQTIFIGIPNWSNTLPPIVRTFLSKQLYKNKLVIPVVSYYRMKDAPIKEEVVKYSIDNKVSKPLIIKQSNLSKDQLQSFLDEITC